jgi:hypothetical protein
MSWELGLVRVSYCLDQRKKGVALSHHSSLKGMLRAENCYLYPKKEQVLSCYLYLKAR